MGYCKLSGICGIIIGILLSGIRGISGMWDIVKWDLIAFSHCHSRIAQYSPVIHPTFIRDLSGIHLVINMN